MLHFFHICEIKKQQKEKPLIVFDTKLNISYRFFTFLDLLLIFLKIF